jgi:hypothetical protein
VGETYYDFRFNDPLPGLATDYWFVHAHPDDPGGLINPANWAHELRVTNSSFNLEKAPVVRGGAFFVGDYQGLAAAGNNFLPFWAQPGQTDRANIFFRRIEQADEHQHHDQSDDDHQQQHKGDGHEEDQGHARSRSASLDLTGSNGASDRVEALRLRATWTDQSTAPAPAVKTLSRQSAPLPPGEIAVDEFYAAEVTSKASDNKLTAEVGRNLFFSKSDLDLTDWEALPETFVML